MVCGTRIVVIGSGAAGSAAARSLAASGWDVTLVERGRVGGTCLWYGCMPKKALYNAARALRHAQRAEMFGIGAARGYHWQEVLAWKWHAQQTYAGDQRTILADRGIRLLEGDARFVDVDRIEVPDGPELAFDHAIIAAGSRPVMPPVPGIELADTSAEALSYPSPPRTLLVVGGGFIGIELATVYAAFGTEVTVVTSGPRPLEMLDAETSAVALNRLARGGVVFHTHCRLTGLGGVPGAIEAAFSDARGASHEGVWERVLVAIGRTPAVDGLELHAAGVELDARGRIVHDGYLRTTNPAVWVAGDASGGMMQTPVAAMEGRTVAASIESGSPRMPEYSAIPTCVFTAPQIAQAGLDEATALEHGHEVVVSRQPFEFLGAAVIEDERDGLVKLVWSARDGRLVGAHIAGPTASDLAYAMAIAIRHGATRESIAETIGIHPAFNEALNWAAW